jgi:hypothetical protein
LDENLTLAILKNARKPYHLGVAAFWLKWPKIEN